MGHHKRKKRKNSRAGCTICKPFPKPTTQVIAGSSPAGDANEVLRSGSAPVWGTGGRGFDSRHLDHPPVV